MDQDRPTQELIGDFQAVRQQQIELPGDLASVDWITPRETIWGEKPLPWVVTKTYQHTWEHGNTLLRMGLWWQDILDDLAPKAQPK